jgi:hypothetical protein
MTELLHAHSRLAVDPPDLIIDGRLAFSRHGLLIALALTRRRRVWLGQGIWALLQRFEVIDYPEFADALEDAREMLPALREWHAVWTGGTLLERFCWIGDILFESRLPPDFDQCSVWRLQHFALLLERFAATEGPISSLTICARDSAALAALRAIDAPIMLTAAEEGSAPRLWRFLEAAGIPCQEATGAAAESLARGALGSTPPPVLPLALAAGARIAAVALLCPRGVAAMLQSEGDLDPDDAPYSEEDDPWRDAQGFWCAVTA